MVNMFKSIKFKLWIITFVLVLFAVGLTTYSVYGTTPTWQYKTDIIITDTGGTNRTNLVVFPGINTANIINQGYVNATGTNTDVQLNNVDQNYMFVNSDMPIVVSSLGANQNNTYTLYTGYSPVQTTFPIIVGSGGYVTMPDGTELGDVWKVEIQGYTDLVSGVNKNLVFKDLAFKIWVSDTNEISAAIYNTDWDTSKVVATGLTPGVNYIVLESDGTDMMLYVNGSLKDTEALGGLVVPDNANIWYLIQNDSMLYMDFFKIWID